MYAIIIHGGAGQWPSERLHRAQEGVERALHVGTSILIRNGTALDAVENAVRILEDDPVFDAGTGSYANTDGEVEMDAIIADGATGKFGAVAAIRNVRNPVSVARKIMEETPHCLLAGNGATRFAHANGFEFTPTQILLGDAASPLGDTVGAVALDERGHIAVATSTGGTRGKMPGRVGDSPLFGCGAYANINCGVSTTGVGEYIMRTLLAKTVGDGIDRGLTPALAIKGALAKLEHIGGHGGIIALDREGRVGFVCNTVAMPVAFIDGKGLRGEE
ncbi:MAG: isoaspartyl peptidase/L-asparaginase family protein [Candidatus Hydrogenedentes bacterium]|nr:isoaspartyl peptidase/L-asparaginase family protein [Candidatus Hydrogenedentota bacterium]